MNITEKNIPLANKRDIFFYFEALSMQISNDIFGIFNID